MTIPRGPYAPVASCGYNENHKANLNPDEIAILKIEKKSNNDDNLMMIGTTGLYTGLCFTALAFGGTIAPAILTVAGVAVVGVGVGIAGYYAVEYVKNQFKNTTALSSNPSTTPRPQKNYLKEQEKGKGVFFGF